MQLRELVQFHQAATASYIRLAAVSVDPPAVNAALRVGLGAQFSFLSDAGLALTDALGIRENTDKRHGPLPVPYTFALEANLTIQHLFNGWYMAGRPTPEELRQLARKLIAKSVADFDFSGT